MLNSIEVHPSTENFELSFTEPVHLNCVMSFFSRAHLDNTFKMTNNVNSTSLSAHSFCLINEVLDVMLSRTGRWEEWRRLAHSGAIVQEDGGWSEDRG